MFGSNTPIWDGYEECQVYLTFYQAFWYMVFEAIMLEGHHGMQESVENHLRSRRQAKGLSQAVLARVAGVTRQAVCAIEANQYLPTTGVALALARSLGCRVEDLFCLGPGDGILEGDWVGPQPPVWPDEVPIRVNVAQVGSRFVVRPLSALGDRLAFAISADGLLSPQREAIRSTKGSRSPVRVSLLRDRGAVEQEVVIAGCDPAVFLLGEYVRRRVHGASVVGWTMGSTAALKALKQGEVHVAGIHVVDPNTGESNLPFLRRHLRASEVKVVTFAQWEQGLMVRPGNPLGIRAVEDLARPDVSIVNREPGAAARLLLDRKAAEAGIQASRLIGYRRLAFSHLEVARLVAEGQVDVGIGIGSAARLFGLVFLPLLKERYDLVIPHSLLEAHPTVPLLLDTLASRAFHREVDALGGYDTQHTGRIVEWRQTA